MHIVCNNITALLITSKYLQNKTTSWQDRLYLFLIFIIEKYRLEASSNPGSLI